MGDQAASAKAGVFPSELRVQDNGRILRISFEDGCVGSITAERLRQASPDSDIWRPLPDVAIVDIEQVDAYSIRIGFDDGHDTGVYTWRMLRALTTH